MKIASEDRLLLLIKFLDDEDIKVKEAAGGVIANLALSHSNHKVMVEAGVIPKLVRILDPSVNAISFNKLQVNFHQIYTHNLLNRVHIYFEHCFIIVTVKFNVFFFFFS